MKNFPVKNEIIRCGSERRKKIPPNIFTMSLTFSLSPYFKKLAHWRPTKISMEYFPVRGHDSNKNEKIKEKQEKRNLQFSLVKITQIIMDSQISSSGKFPISIVLVSSKNKKENEKKPE
jgi:hypothetical protein